jgi:RNA polymerase sigma-70 factor (ECF subfamily)
VVSGAVADDDFEAWVAPFRRELLAHCYRMTGSLHDAEDLLQEALVRAWRARDRYDAGRASVRTWLYRITTNACLTELERRAKRPLPSLAVDVSDDVAAEMVPDAETPWLQPFPTGRSGWDDPSVAASEREGLRLAFVAAAQELPARQRAVLLLRDVLQWPAADVAECLEVSVASVNSGLQRARATIARNDPTPDEQRLPASRAERAVLERYVDAFCRADLDGLVRLLRDDVVLEMPPVPLWFVGSDHYGAFMRRVYTMRPGPWRATTLSANTQPAFAAYAFVDGRYRAHSIQVLDIAAAGVAHNVVFADATMFRDFDLPAELPPGT